MDRRKTEGKEGNLRFVGRSTHLGNLRRRELVICVG